jgi:hypothetical protein
MTLPVSGPISLNNVNVELGLSGTTSINMNQASVRTLFGVPSGAIAMSDGYGKANQFSFTISSDTTNGNLGTLATAAGWNGSSALVATIAPGIYVSSNSTGTPGLTISGSFPGGVSLINNGLIVGMGGSGGPGGTGPDQPGFYGSSGGGGGTALAVSSAVTLTNNGTIAGGGGGGGGAGGSFGSAYYTAVYCAGGGGGGGRTGRTNSSGGSGASAYFAGSSGGSGGTAASAGNGGGGSVYPPYIYGENPEDVYPGFSGGSGGSGGAYGSTGTGGSPGSRAPAGLNGGGGSAGSAVTGNSNITYISTGTRLGPIS